MKMAAGGEIPAAPVLAPKTAPRIKVLGANVSAASRPARTLPGLAAAPDVEITAYRVRAEHRTVGAAAPGRDVGGARAKSGRAPGQSLMWCVEAARRCAA